VSSLVLRIGLCLAPALVGCTAEDYRRSADAQVNSILRQRQERTLGYQPPVEVGADAPAPTPKRVYDKIPLTFLPPPTTAPIERVKLDLSKATYGPDVKWMKAPVMEEALSASEPERPGRGVVFGPPAPAAPPARLDLFGSVAYGVQNGRSYRDRMDTLYLSALDVTLQRHLFGPRPFARVSYTYDGGQADVNYRSALTAAASAGVRHRLPYGGEVVAEALTQFVTALNDNTSDGESASVAISGSIPLLRGAGLVNLEPLIRSERQVVYQVRAFEAFRRSFAVDIASRYFRLLTLQQSVANRRRNLVNLTNLTTQMRALYAADRLNFLQVQQSLQARLQAESSLLDAQDAYDAAIDEFKLAVGMPADQTLEIAGSELTVLVPREPETRAIDLALRLRLELQTARDRIDDAGRLVEVARNGLLPDLDLAARAALGNRADTSAAALDSRTLTYSASVTLDLPVDRLAERNQYRAALIAQREAQRQYEQSCQEVAAEVRDAMRAIRNAEANLLIQRRGIELAERRLDFANDLLRAGRPGVTARDLVEAQSSLLDAQDRYNRARSQLQVRVLEYLRDTGQLRVDPKAGELGQAMRQLTTPAPGQE
jgi:outer membrane protein TolC